MSYFWGWGDDVDVSIIDANARCGRRAGSPWADRSACTTAPSPNAPSSCSTSRSPSAWRPSARAPSFPYRWQDGYHSRVGLLPRDGDSTEVVWHDVEPCYVFHVMNAYDEPGGDGVVLDVVRHPSMFRTHLLGPSEGAPTLERWHLDGHGGAVKEERLDDRGQEFPRVDERVVGRPHRYGYAVAVRSPTTFSGPSRCWCATTSTRGTSVERRSVAAGRRGGFVPRDDDAGEADGWLLTLVYSPPDRHLRPLLLNAADPPASAGRRRAAPARPGRVPRQLGARPALTPPSGCLSAPGVGFRRDPLALGPAAPAASVLILAFVIVSSAGGTAWALVFRTVSSPVGLREALRIYRREQTEKMLTPRNPSRPRRLLLRTSGERPEPDGLARSFPPTTSMIVEDGVCATVSWVPISGTPRRRRSAPGPKAAQRAAARHQRVDRRPDTTSTSYARRRRTCCRPAPPRTEVECHLCLAEPGREGGAGGRGARSSHHDDRRPRASPSSTPALL